MTKQNAYFDPKGNPDFVLELLRYHSYFKYIFDKSHHKLIEFKPNENIFKYEVEDIDFIHGYTVHHLECEANPEYLLPFHTETFQAFIKETVTLPVSSDSDIINEVKDKILRLNPYPKDTVQINTFTKQFVLISESGSNNFKCILDDDSIHSFKFKETALKLLFDSAIANHDYHSPESRESLSKFKEHLKSPEFDLEVQKLVDSIKKESQKIDDFFDSGSFEITCNVLKKDLEKRNINSLSSEDLLYDTDKKYSFIHEDDFFLLIDTAFKKYPSNMDNECAFENKSVIAFGLKFFMMIGQGTFHSVSIV